MDILGEHQVFIVCINPILIIVLLVSFSVLKNEKAIDRLFENCGIKCKRNDKKEQN